MSKIDIKTSGKRVNVKSSGDNLNIKSSKERLSLKTIAKRLNLKPRDERLNIKTSVGQDGKDGKDGTDGVSAIDRKWAVQDTSFTYASGLIYKQITTLDNKVIYYVFNNLKQLLFKVRDNKITSFIKSNNILTSIKIQAITGTLLPPDTEISTDKTKLYIKEIKVSSGSTLDAVIAYQIKIAKAGRDIHTSAEITDKFYWQGIDIPVLSAGNYIAYSRYKTTHLNSGAYSSWGTGKQFTL